MKRPYHFLLGPLGVLLFLGLVPAGAQENPRENQTQALLLLLEKKVETKDLQSSMTLQEFLGLISEHFRAKGKVLQVFVSPVWDDSDDIYQKTVRFFSIPRQLPLGVMLRLALDQLEKREATFLVRNGALEIVPAKHATPAYLLKERVHKAFWKSHLYEVLQDLSYQTGASLVLDPRAEVQAQTRITATFRNDTTLEAALLMVTEMAGLKLVILPGGLFVTTPAHAEVLQKMMEKSPGTTSDQNQPGRKKTQIKSRR